MCFAIPKKVQSVRNNCAVMEDGTQVMLGTINAKPGAYLTVYGNMAVEKLSKKQALQTRKLINKIDNDT